MGFGGCEGVDVDYRLLIGYGFKGQNDLYFTQYASLVPAGVL
jgi:hypothetical protein